MYYELALISVLVAGGYWGWFFVRGALRGYGAMLLAAAAFAGLGLLGRSKDVPGLGLVGAIGVGAGTCLLVLGPFARGLARRAAGAERFALAQRLLAIADVLSPGAGVGDDKALVLAMREARDGHVEPTIDALVAAKQRAPADATVAIDERIAMLYLAVYRWDEAIAHAEAHLFSLGSLPAATDSKTRANLRTTLGIAPPVFVELLGAYGYRGDLERAAAMLAQLEDACAGRRDAGLWLYRARLMFLALSGRVDAVQTLIAPRHSRHMTRAARTYWLAVAHERRGERDAARAAYTRARARSRGRPRMLIDEALLRVETAQPVELTTSARDVVARVEAAPVPAVEIRAAARGPIATRVLAGTIVLVAVAIATFIGDSSDVGVLVRGGAMVRGMVADGELWRLISCIFVHVGGAHLIVNTIGLLFIGRLAEEIFGAWRTACVFALAGLAGSVASYLASPAGVSAGASGAIFGLLGAVFVELTLQRKHYRGAWSRGVWGSIAVVAVAQLAVGFLYPVIDQSAHGAGLLVGALAGAALSPHARRAKVGQHVARLVVIAFALAVAASGWLVVSTSVSDSLARSPSVAHRVGDLVVSAPASWRVNGDQLTDRDQLIVLSFALGRGEDGKTAVSSWIAKHVAQEHTDHGNDVAPAVGHIALPAGWQADELELALADSNGDKQTMRVIYAGRALDDSAVVVEIELPDSIAHAAPAFLAQVVASVAVAR